MTTFKIPSNLRFSEEIGLHLTFQDVTIRGSKKTTCQVLVTEQGDGHDVNDSYNFASWEQMKEEYPTMLDFLKELSYNDNWDASWRDNDRILFIESSIGHKGLYDMNKTVFYDCQDTENNPEEKKAKKLKIK